MGVDSCYEKGLAFVVEGATERVFYEEYLASLCDAMGMQMVKNLGTQENSYIVTRGDRSLVVMINSVGSVTQMTNSQTWFKRTCRDGFEKMPWYVFLCYDTDCYTGDITKFYESDWRRLRQAIEEDAESVTDLAACADIEDIILCDLSGVLAFLGLSPETGMPNGRKGKAKLKKLFRMVAINNAYHEGGRARELIRALDMSKIERVAPIPLSAIKDVLEL